MARLLVSLYLRHATIVTYMLQSTEYEVGPYLQWYWRTRNFSKVMHRRNLDPTRRARLIRLVLRACMGVQAISGIVLIADGIATSGVYQVLVGAALLLTYPIIWAHLIVIPLLLVKWVIVSPKQKRLVQRSKTLFAQHRAVKIAVAGSYGKTTMKELLYSVLSTGMKTAATPANKNVAISHARFIENLQGDEEVLIIEYGEGAPGDVVQFTDTTQPDYVIITGIAPAHLDKYKTLEAAAQDIFSATKNVPSDHVYVNQESPEAAPYIQPTFQAYSRAGVGQWTVTDIKVNMDGTQFTLRHDGRDIPVKTPLLGRHQIGPLCTVIKLAFGLGMSETQILQVVATIKAYEHRMQPYMLGGAVIIDDTYNGNIEGARAGTSLLAELDAKRKWYVTPGLVEQGELSVAVHEQLGRLIAAAKPDIVVLMQNSVTGSIKQGLDAGSFQGEIRLEDDPLSFYGNLSHYVAAGDVVLMQNDWTDNYA